MSLASAVYTQIQHVVESTSRGNSASVVSQVRELAKSYGSEVESYATAVAITQYSAKRSGAQSGFEKVLAELLRDFIPRSDFISRVCEAFNASGKSFGLPTISVTASWLQALIADATFSEEEAVMVVGALAHSPASTVADIAAKALSELLISLPERKEGYPHLAYFAPRLRRLIDVHQFFEDNPGMASKCLDILSTRAALKASLGDSDPLEELSNDIGKAISPSTLVQELGFKCTSSPALFREALVGAHREPEGAGTESKASMPLHPREIGEMLLMMGTTLSDFKRSTPSSVYSAFANGLEMSTTLDAELGVSSPMSSSQLTTESARSCSTQDPDLMVGTWSADVVGKVLGEDYPGLDWKEVVLGMDRAVDNLSIDAFHFFINVQKSAADAATPRYKPAFPVEALLQPWVNPSTQGALLSYSITYVRPLVSFFEVTPRFDVGVMSTASKEQSSSTGIANGAWGCVGVFRALLSCIARTPESAAKSQAKLHIALVERAMNEAPEATLLCLAHCWSESKEASLSDDSLRIRGPVVLSLFRSLFSGLFATPPTMTGDSALLLRMWNSVPKALGAICVSMIRARMASSPASNPLTHLRSVVAGCYSVLLIAKTCPGVAEAVLSSDAHDCAIPFALVYASTTHSGPSGETSASAAITWIQDKIERNELTESYIKALMTFILVGAQATSAAVTIANSARSQQSLPGVSQAEASKSAAVAAAASSIANVVPGTFVQAVFSAIDRKRSSLTPDSLTAVEGVRSVASSVWPSHVRRTTSVEDKANAMFQKIFAAPEGEFEAVVSSLKYLKSSSDQEDRRVFDCMVNNLLDEYKEFHKYPDAELEKTGRLVGLLIQQQLLASSRLGVALRYVLESLRRPASSPSHTRYLRFGLAALRQFSSRLPKWKQYSEHILAIPALQQYEHGLIQALASALGTSVPQASSHNPSDDAIVTAVNAAVSAETEPQDSDLLVDLPSDLGTLDLLSGDETLAKQVPTGGNANTSSGSGSGSGSKSGGSNANNSSGKGNKGGSNDSSAGTDSGNGSGEDGGNGDDGDQDRNDEQKDPALSLKEEMETRRQQLRDQLGMAGPYLSEVLAALAEGTVVPKKPRGSAKKEGDNKENEEERPEEEAYDEGETKEDVRHHLDDSDDEDDVDERGVPLPDAVPRRLVVRFPEESVVDPPQKVKDKLLFVVNNITERNAESKADEVTALLDPRVYSWLSRHLVSQRLCTQPNYHVAYRTWLDRLDIPELETAITREVLIRVRVLLGSSTIRSSSDERLQLKNLGSWLGLSTLANNVPLLQRYLDLKEVIFDAYERGRLIAAVPFVAKILEHAKDSKVFQPPNPWTMGMLNALREIYNVPDLKLNLKFQVEVLCNHLNIEISSLNASTILVRRFRPTFENNPDLNLKSGAPTAPLPGVDATNSSMPVLGSRQKNRPVIPGLKKLVQVDSRLGLFQAMRRLRDLVPLAVDAAVREILKPVVERSVTIACITARELIVKDFAMEPSADRMHGGSKLMVSNLAGSLALVTCQEPLRLNIKNFLAQLIRANAPNANKQHATVAIEKCAADNLELACLLVEKAATEKAIRDVTDTLSLTLEQRRKAVASGVPYYNLSIFSPPSSAGASSTRWPRALPDELRPVPLPGGLGDSALHVYDGFKGHLPTSVREGALKELHSSPVTLQTGNFPRSSAHPQQQQGVVGLTASQARDAYNTALEKLDQLSDRLSANGGVNANLSSLPPNHEILNFIKEVGLIGIHTPSQDLPSVAVPFAQEVFRRYMGPNTSGELVKQVQLGFLAAVAEAYNPLPRDIASWMALLPEHAKLQVDRVSALIRSRLLPVVLYDPQLVAVLSGGTNTTGVEFSISLLHRVLIVDRSSRPPDFRGTLEVLVRVAQAQAQAMRAGVAEVTFPGLTPLLSAVRHIQLAASSSAASSQAMHPASIPTSAAGVNGVAPPRAMPQEAHAGGLPASAPIPSSQAGGGGGGGPTSSDPKLVASGPGPAVAEALASVKNVALKLFDEWISAYDAALADAKRDSEIIVGTGVSATGVRTAIGSHVLTLQHQKLLANDTVAEAYFRAIIRYAIDAALSTQASSDDSSQAPKRLNYHIVDSLSCLVSGMVRAVDPLQGKLGLLRKALDAATAILREDAVRRGPDRAEPSPSSFDQRPFLRFFTNLLEDLTTPGVVPEGGEPILLSLFAAAFQSVSPVLLPSFTFAWLDLVTHRTFLPKVMKVPGRKLWEPMYRLLADLLRFMYPYLAATTLNDSVRVLYKALLRVMLVLLHDFPGFLCEYHFVLCDLLPSSCVQLRNLILSAFPTEGQLPDPFAPDLKVDTLPDVQKAPTVACDLHSTLGPLLEHLEGYMKAPAQTRNSHMWRSFVASLPGHLKTAGPEPKYNPSLINALVLLVGSRGAAQLQLVQAQLGPGAMDKQQRLQAATLVHATPACEILHSLAAELDAEGRYLLFTSMTNHLRYPNAHTHFFACVLLHLFAVAETEIDSSSKAAFGEAGQVIQEQITRVLLERLIVHRPHPWGLLITFMELIRNPRYHFWDHSWVRCAPEVERLLQSVARSCASAGSGTGAAAAGSLGAAALGGAPQATGFTATGHAAESGSIGARGAAGTIPH